MSGLVYEVLHEFCQKKKQGAATSNLSGTYGEKNQRFMFLI